MSKGLISFMLALGISVWVYEKFQRYSGNNTRQSLVASGIVGFLVLIVAIIILSAVF